MHATVHTDSSTSEFEGRERPEPESKEVSIATRDIGTESTGELDRHVSRRRYEEESTTERWR